MKLTTAKKTEEYSYECGTTSRICVKIATKSIVGATYIGNGRWRRLEPDGCCSPNKPCDLYFKSSNWETTYNSKTCTGTRVVEKQAYSSYGGGGGGSGASLNSSVAIPQDIIEAAHGGSLKIVTGFGTSGDGNPSSVSVVGNGIILWSLSANGGKKGHDAESGSVGNGGNGANSANSCIAGLKGGDGGSNTSNTNSNVQGAQGTGAGSSYGAGGKGGTIIVNQNGKQGEIEPAKGNDGYVKVNYIKLTR